MRPFLHRWSWAVLLGLPGILVLGAQFSVPQAALPPGLRDASPLVVALLAMLNPLLLLVVAAAVGAAVAPATGLRSIAASAWRRRPGEPAAWARLAPHLPVAIAGGLGVAVLLHLADRWQVAPQDMVMIGDHRHDLACGRAAGTATVLVNLPSNPWPELTDHFVADCAALQRLALGAAAG